jgi:hypothetical protein
MEPTFLIPRTIKIYPDWDFDMQIYHPANLICRCKACIAKRVQILSKVVKHSLSRKVCFLLFHLERFLVLRFFYSAPKISFSFAGTRSKLNLLNQSSLLFLLTRWPDWANFRLLGDCKTLESLVNNTEEAQMIGPLFA